MNIFDIINFVLNEQSGCSADGSALALGERVKTVNERFDEGKCTKQGVEGAVNRNAQRLCDCTGRTKQLYIEIKLNNRDVAQLVARLLWVSEQKRSMSVFAKGSARSKELKARLTATRNDYATAQGVQSNFI